MRLIDADELKLELKWLEIDTPVYHDVMTTIDEIETVDAVEVVRCKDCQFYTTINYIKGKFCIKHSHLGDDFVFHCDEDDFCSWGKRR